MKQRVITGLLLSLGAIGAFYVGGIILRVLVGVIVLIAIHEILNLCKKNNLPKFVEIYCYLAGLAMYLCYPEELLLPSHVYLTFMLGMFVCVILFEHLSIDEALLFISMMTLSVTGIRGIYTIDTQHGFLNILYLALATFGCDTGAYFAGYFFGKHKLIERLSPKKTIEGSIGGILLGTTLAFCLGLFYDLGMPLYQVFILAFILTITSQFGDLTFSALKRRYGIKDFSNLLPGHGGVLDRVDSLIFNIVVYCSWFVFFL